MKKFNNFLYLSFILLAIISCNGDDSNTSAKNPVACFINGVYDETGFVIAQIKDSSTFRQSIVFPGASTPYEFPAGNQSVRFIEKNTGLDLFNISTNFSNGKNYSLVLCNKKSSLNAFVLQNDVAIMDTNNTSIKFLNLIPNSNFDIFVNGTNATATNLGFTSYTNPVEVNPKVANSIVIRQTGSTIDLLSNKNFRGTAKKAFTIYLTGVLGGTPTPSMNFIAHN
ncbi:MAG: DUF4397 domain-containing protein [Saprospiraceae bacterium]